MEVEWDGKMPARRSQKSTAEDHHSIAEGLEGVRLHSSPFSSMLNKNVSQEFREDKEIRDRRRRETKRRRKCYLRFSSSW